MPTQTIWILEASNISVSGGKTLDGVTQGDGSHLEGETITLLNANWLETTITDNDSSFDDNDSGQRLSGRQWIDGTRYNNGTRVEAEYRIVMTDADGNSYEAIAYNVNNSSPSYGTIEGLSFVGPPQGWPPVGVPLTVGAATEGPGGSGQAPIDSTDLVVPCFTPGTLIATPRGAVPVECLRAGHAVCTRDRGVRKVRWAGSVTLNAADLAARPALRPIRIRRGAFGPGRPARDLLVSPQHRILLTGWRAELFFGETEVLAAAQHLIDDQSVTVARDGAPVTYVHFMFDRHEIVWADGLETESFRPGRLGLGALPDSSRSELLHLFPELMTGAHPALDPARPILRKWESAVLAR